MAHTAEVSPQLGNFAREGNHSHHLGERVSFVGLTMPVIEVIYSGLIRTTVPCYSETYELAAKATLRDLLTEVIRRHGDYARRYLFSDDFSKLAPGAAVRMGLFAARDLNAYIGADERVQVVVMSPMMVGG